MSKKVLLKAPLSGKTIPIEEVGDPVFSDKIMGDGIAIIPSSGEILAPVDGCLAMIAATKHAFGFSTPDGIEILVHVGLETVSLNGEPFKILANQGDTVKAGDKIAEVDLEMLREKNITATTPIILSAGVDDATISKHAGKDVVAGKDDVIELEFASEDNIEVCPVRDDQVCDIKDDALKDEQPKKEKKKSSGKLFDFFQRFGKALMVVIAVIPAAGILISLGTCFSTFGAGIPACELAGTVIGQIGWAVINNLSILFAVAIGGAWAKERAGGAFAALLAFMTINIVTGKMFGVSEQMILVSDPQKVAAMGLTSEQIAAIGTTTTNMFGQTMPINGYFTMILGQPALNMGAFVGIIAGFLGAVLYNKYYNFKGLPDVLSFFNGKRFVPLVVMFFSALVGIAACFVWPFIQGGINGFGTWLAESKDSMPFVGPFLYGTAERLLLPFGLHHMLTIPMNYTEMGGTYTAMTGSLAGQTVAGQEGLWLAWAQDLGNYLAQGNTQAYNDLIASVTPARFKAGQMIGSFGLIIGIALAMYKNVDKDKKKLYASMFISTIAATVLTGVTEPIEYMFMFVAMPLYVIYAILQGICFGLADLLPLRLHAFGLIDTLVRVPMDINAHLTTDLICLVLCSLAALGVGFVVANFMIKKFHYATPGRLGNYDDAEQATQDAEKEGNKDLGDSQPARIIALLGGADNIELVDACMTRLRVTIKDPSKVAALEAWRKEGAKGLVANGVGIQAIYGPKADGIKNDINELLGK